MSGSEIEHRLEQVVLEAFGLEALPQNASSENVEGWDSMAHVGLMMALQDEFQVSIPPEDMIKLTDFDKIRTFLSSRVCS